MKKRLNLKIVKRPPLDVHGRCLNPADKPKLRLYFQVMRRMAKYGITEEEALAEAQKFGICQYRREKDGPICGAEISPLRRICDDCLKLQGSARAAQYRNRLVDKKCEDCGGKFKGRDRTKLCKECRYKPDHCGGTPKGEKRGPRSMVRKKPLPPPRRAGGMTVSEREKEWASRLPPSWHKKADRPLEDPPKPAPVEVPRGFKVTYGPPAPGRWDNPEV